MAVDHIRYDLLTQQALRGVVRTVLTDVAKNGLPGEHHFYIAFNTQAPGVRISGRLREQYPQEMTVILQHQFWDLTVTSDGFEVGLSFGGISERLVIPFEAIKGFFDPSVQFGLQFETEAEGAAAPLATVPNVPEKPVRKRTRQQKAERPERPERPLTVAPQPPEVEHPPKAVDEVPQDQPPASGGGEVVRLDRFRKK